MSMRTCEADEIMFDKMLVVNNGICFVILYTYVLQWFIEK
jgi:hypothetical protein